MPSGRDLISAVREAAKHQPDAMITVSLPSDEKKWLQLLSDTINLSYPFDKPPMHQLTELNIPHANKVDVGFWEERLFADFETTSMSNDELCDFINAYLVAAFGSADLNDYAVSFEVAERGTIVADSDYDFLRQIVQLKRYFEGRSPRKP